MTILSRLLDVVLPPETNSAAQPEAPAPPATADLLFSANIQYRLRPSKTDSGFLIDILDNNKQIAGTWSPLTGIDTFNTAEGRKLHGLPIPEATKLANACARLWCELAPAE